MSLTPEVSIFNLLFLTMTVCVVRSSVSFTKWSVPLRLRLRLRLVTEFVKQICVVSWI